MGEKKLKISMHESEEKEKRAKYEETRINKVREDLEHTFKLKQEEVLSTIKRIKIDKKHEIDLMTKENLHLKHELGKLENKLKAQEVDYQEMKRGLLHEKHKKETSTMGQLKMENKGLKSNIEILERQVKEFQH